MSFINERIKDKEEINKATFEEVLVQLNKLKDDPFEKAAFEYFDLISWLEAKIKGVSFREIVQEKIKHISI